MVTWLTDSSRIKILGACLCLISGSLFAQSPFSTADQADSIYQMAEALFSSDNPTEETDKRALELYQESINLCESDSSQYKLWADCYHKMGVIYTDKRDFLTAIKKFAYAIKIREYAPLLSDSLHYEDLVYMGDAYSFLSKTDSAEYFFQQAERVIARFPSISKQTKLYNSLGSYYFSLGNYYRSSNYLRKSLRVIESTKPVDEYERDILKNNIALTELKIGNYAEAIAIFRTIVRNKLDAYTLFHNVGTAFKEQNQYDSAIYYLKLALPNANRRTKNITLNNLGIVYTSLGKLDSAANYYQAALKLNDSLFADKNVIRANTYQIIGMMKSEQSDFDSALYYLQKSLIAQNYLFTDQNIHTNPTDFSNAISLLTLFSTLQEKAIAFREAYAKDGRLDCLKSAFSTYQLAIRVARHIQKTYDNDEAKLFLVNKVAPIYEEAIATAVQLYELTQDPQYVEQAFQFSENSKASVLAESLRDVKIKAMGEVSDSLLREEQRVKQQITALRLKLVESHDSVRSETYRQQLNDLEIALARTVKYLQKDEHYYQRKYQPDTLDIAGLQRSLLSSDGALLEYFVGQEQVYLFLMTQDDLQVIPVERTAELDSAWQRTRRQLYTYKPGQGNDEASLATLYRFLINPVAETIADVSRLTIIPDGLLHYLPFGLLSVDGRRANYLLRTHTLHYGYSAFLLQQAINERREFPTKSVLAMAPFAGPAAGNSARSQGFNLLRDSQAEVESIRGSMYTKGRATKRQFLKVAGSYNVLHLATHASVNSEDPSQSFIAFYPQQRDSIANYRLYTHELYNLRLDSVKLVVLSACEAGNGQLVRGEGVMSLARAFAYAGCPNIVTTLWKADDRSSAYLTSRMHYYLKKGWEKDESLQQATLDYLDDESVQPSQKAPYYWAHFVFIGDPAPLYDNSHIGWWIAAGLVLLTAAGLWMVRKKKRTRAMA